MRHTKEKALIKMGVGVATKDKAIALDGINEFIRLSIMELEMDRMEDEAELHDYYMMQDGGPQFLVVHNK